MAVFKRNSNSSSDGAVAEHGKTEYESKTGEVIPHVAPDGAVDYHDNKHLHRGLKSRHITMIAIGGAIGTGLIIGTGKALYQSGYVPVDYL
jgi:amino acid transporter